MRRVTAILLCILLLTLLNGCFDAREISDIVYVAVVGIDRGVSDRWRITIQAPDVGSSGGGGGGSPVGATGGMKYETMTIDAPSFFAGVNLANTNIPRRLNFTHMYALVVSEDIANAGLLDEIITPLVRFREIRRSVNIVISRGSAMEFVKANKPFIGGTMSKKIEDMINESYDTGLFPHITLGDFINSMKSSSIQPIAMLGAVNDGGSLKEKGPFYQGEYKETGDYLAGEVPRQGGNKVELVGCIIANGSKTVAELTGYETRLLQMVTNRFQRGIFSFPDPEVKDLVVPLDVRQNGRTDVSVKMDGDKYRIHAVVHFEGDIIAIQSRVHYEDPDKQKELENAFNQYISRDMNNLIKKCQGVNSDVFGFGRSVEVKDYTWSTIENWEQLNWKKTFSESEISAEVDLKIRRTGAMVDDSPIISSEGKK